VTATLGAELAPVPFFPTDHFAADRAALLGIVREVATDPEQRFILGPRTARFEAALRDGLGAADVVCCGSGTSAVTLALAAMGVGPGDEVIVPALGCAPLASTVAGLGAVPAFADVDPHGLVMDPEAAEALVGPRTRALMPAHLFSVLADLPRLRAVADRHGLRLLEDSAVAQGAVLDGRPAGMWGDAGVFSFVQVKSFGGPGEGGAICTSDPELAAAVRSLRNHGQDGVHRFVHHRVGWNSRFDEILAAFQLHRLPGLPARLARRAAIGAYYGERFAPLAERGILAPPPPRDGEQRCWYVYTLLAEERDALRRHLAARGVDSHVYYPEPLPRQPAFARFAPPGARWPHAGHAARHMVSVPNYPQLTDGEVERVADAVCSFAGRGGGGRTDRSV
jgi:dTDP-4-amino-4,6-dideoxygalactose transaminase